MFKFKGNCIFNLYFSQLDIDEHIATLDVNNPRDYIDEYLIEMEKKKDDPDNTMSSMIYKFIVPVELLNCFG